MRFLNLIIIALLIAFAVPAMAQKKNNTGSGMYVRGKSKSDYFGERSAPKKMMKNRSDKVRPFGFQAQLGATMTLVNPDPKNKTGVITPTGESYEINPLTRPGIYAEIGFVHMNVRSKSAARQRIIDYVDYGIGFKLFHGDEKIDIMGNHMNISGLNRFQIGNLNLRVGVHKLQYLTTKKNFFIDHSLGINFDYRVLEKSEHSVLSGVFPQQYSGKPSLMLHYDVGLGIRVAKGKYIVVGVQAPFVEFLDKPMGNPSFNWFSSSYYPFMARIKYIHLFPAKKPKHACWTGDEEQRKMNEQFLQGQ